MARVLVTGAGGLVGRALLRLAPPGWQCHGTWRRRPIDVAGVHAHRVELVDALATRRLVAELRPDLVVHAAYTKTERADIVAATASVARAATDGGAALVHLSSDVVFDGEHAPYREQDPPAPVDDYGRWKAEADAAALAACADAAIVRPSLVVSTDPLDHTSRWVADGLAAGRRLDLFVDELRSPIAVADLAAAIWELAGLARPARAGVWHVAGPEVVSRYSLGLLIARHLGADSAPIVGALNASHPTPRPRDLRLHTTRADRQLRTRPRPVSAVFAGIDPAGG